MTEIIFEKYGKNLKVFAESSFSGRLFYSGWKSSSDEIISSVFPTSITWSPF